MKKKYYIIILFVLSLTLLLTGCNEYGQGSLKLIVYNNNQLVNDVYVGIYNKSNQRISFAYTLKGEASFKGLIKGVYLVKVIDPSSNKKQFKVYIEPDKTKILKAQLQE